VPITNQIIFIDKTYYMHLKYPFMVTT